MSLDSLDLWHGVTNFLATISCAPVQLELSILFSREAVEGSFTVSDNFVAA